MPVSPQVQIPSQITVHLGAAADQSAPNVTVSFPDYIKNVASSEIYPTWPENALRANIYAQISFALNRIYTEYYHSRGYDFDITNSTAADQSFVYGRNIFENISQIVDEIFNSYVVRQGSIEPLFTQYCNGTTVSCGGLSQWGSVALAQQGLTPYQILQRYFGDDINIVRNVPVSGLRPSAPTAPLALGSGGNDVTNVQIRLNRISKNYPAIPKAREITTDNGSSLWRYSGFYMMDFEIVAGELDFSETCYVDRGAVDTARVNRGTGAYKWDYMHKGVADTVPEVRTELYASIDPEDTVIPVTLYNSYNPMGMESSFWFTHLNPQCDPYTHESPAVEGELRRTRDIAAESDLLHYRYDDGLKEGLYQEPVTRPKQSASWAGTRPRLRLSSSSRSWSNTT